MDSASTDGTTTATVEADLAYIEFADDPELFDGLPVGLQLIGRTLEEEGVIAMTEVVVEALKNAESA